MIETKREASTPKKHSVGLHPYVFMAVIALLFGAILPAAATVTVATWTVLGIGLVVIVALAVRRQIAYNSVPVWLTAATMVQVVGFLGPATQGRHSFALRLPPSTDGLRLAVILAILSLCAFLVAWRPPPKHLSRALASPRIDPTVYWILQFVALALFLFALRAAEIPLSQALTTLSETGYGNPQLSSISGALALVGNIGLIVTPLLLVADAWIYGGPLAKLLTSINCAGMLVVDAAFGARYRPFLLLGALFLLWRELSRGRGRRRPVQTALVSASVAIAFLAGAIWIAQVRGPTVNYGPGYYSGLAELDLLTPSAATVDALRADGDFLLGRSYLDIPRQAIPRQLWRDKPEPVTIGLIKKVGDPQSGMAVPAFIEVYANFGAVGVLALSFLAGRFAARAVARWRSQGGAHGYVAVCLAPPLAVQLFSRGYAVQAVYTIAYLYVPLLLIRLLHARFTRRSSPGPQLAVARPT